MALLDVLHGNRGAYDCDHARRDGLIGSPVPSEIFLPTAFSVTKVQLVNSMPNACLISILALALSLGVAGCGGSATPTTFDLSAPRDFGKLRGSRAAIVVNEPTTVQTLDSDRVIVKDSAGALSFLGGMQWADRVPKLVQIRLIETFENGSRIASVSRPGQRIVPDYQLNTDIRAFNIDAGSGSAVVEITAKLVADKTGHIQRAKLFTARVPAIAIDGPGAAQVLDQALSQVLLQIVRWVV